ncbi:hypothetical protein T484DRAFT_1794011 [Baffinella frigidus]|nr:hypothetical protein T484DRAFT_1794011 [Cryptophyta sp. CCMP2293]
MTGGGFGGDGARLLRLMERVRGDGVAAASAAMERVRGDSVDTARACEALQAELRARDEEARGLRREAVELRAHLEDAAGEHLEDAAGEVGLLLRVEFLVSV